MDLGSGEQKEIDHQNDPSLHDSAPFVVLDPQDKEQTLVTTSDIEALYRVEEDPAKPPLQVPVYLFANTSIEEVRTKDGVSDAEPNEGPSSSHSDLLEQMKTQMLTSLPSQPDDASSVGSGMLVDEDVDVPEFFQSMGRVENDGVTSPRRQIIAIIQETDDENELEMEEDVTEDVLKKFVVDGDGSRSSIGSSHNSGESSEAVHTQFNGGVQLQLRKNPGFTQATGPGQQMLVFSRQKAVSVASSMVTDGQAAEDVIQPSAIRKQLDDKCHAPKRKVTVIGQDEAGEVLKDIPLDMAFQVVAEVATVEGEVLMREITTQTRPAKRPRSYRKRRLKDGVESPLKGPKYVDHEVVVGQSGVARSYDMQLKKFKCSKCTLRFHTEERRDIHVRCHQGSDKNYSCYFCGHTDSQWIKMYHHLFQHGVEKPHKCDHCTFTCVNRSDLSAHMAVHSSSKDWHCSKCGRAFKHRRNMVAHLRSCPGLDETGKPARRPEEEEKFVCGVCQKILSTKKNLEKHMEIHLDLKPFVCDHCGHSTRLKESLIMHKRLHTGEKPYKCKSCDYATPDKSSLRRHNRIHTNDKPYKCQYCDYKCIQKHCLDTHVRRKHTGEQFVCGLCHYATHDRYGLNQHFKRHQNPDGTLDASIPDIETSTSETHSAPTRTLITLPSGALLTSTVIDGGKTTLIAEAPKTSVSSQNMSQVFLRIGDSVSSHLANTPKDTSTSNDNEQPQDSVDGDADKNEETTIQLGRLETDLLQQIQQPGDEVFLQPSGEIVIRRQDGHLLVIQQQDGDDEAFDLPASQRDGQEYLTAASPDEVTNAQPDNSAEAPGIEERSSPHPVRQDADQEADDRIQVVNIDIPGLHKSCGFADRSKMTEPPE